MICSPFCDNSAAELKLRDYIEEYDLNNIRTETGVDNAVVIFVYLDSNKDLVAAEIVK